MTADPDLPRATGLLREALGDRLFTPADAGFPAAVRLWNGATAGRPALVARVRDAGEVALAVRVAGRCRLPLSVRAGGHDWAGRALRDGGLVVDLTALRQVDLDPGTGVVTVGGGATAADVLAAALAGMLLFPLDQAAAVLGGYGAAVREAPDELTVMAGFLPGPAGEPVVFLAPVFTGDDPDAGRPAVDRLRALGTPLVDQVAPLPYEDVLRMFDGGMADGNHYLLRTRWLPGVSGPVVAELVAAARAVTSPYSAIALHHFHGAATRVGVAETAFGLRDAHLLAEIIAVWTPGDDPAPHRAWAERTSAALAPHALPGGYPNLLAPEETDRVRLAYGSNWDRLRRAKLRYDPRGTLSAVPTLPPATPPAPGPGGGRRRRGGTGRSPGALRRGMNSSGTISAARSPMPATHDVPGAVPHRPPARVSRVVGQLFRSPKGVGRQVDPEERLA